MIFTISDDGAVHISAQELFSLTLVHLVSAVDGAPPPPNWRNAQWAPTTGYTEWVSADPSGITIGWDWQTCTQHGSTALRRVGGGRCNLILKDNIVKHVSQYNLSELLCDYIDHFPWQDVTADYLVSRYGT